MVIGTKMQKALNSQINAELYSAYMYLSMAAYLDGESFPGFAHWMKKQAQEEVEHAMKIYTHVYERGGMVELDKIAKPQVAWTSVLTVFKEAYKHEQKVTKLIYDLIDTAKKSDEKATESFLQWFIDEQVEEEDQASAIVEKLKKIGDSGHGLLLLDKELGARE